jgi:hypothetical protein
MMTTGDNRSIIENILEQFSDPISENLSLLHKKILARFTFCIHKPVIAESPQRIGTTGVNPNNTGDTEYSNYSQGSSHGFSSVAASPAAASPAAASPAASEFSLVGESPPNHQLQNEGGKRTKRRRGRGKSKKKVTRKKRVKRRKTVKKIKRKRRRTRKR